MVFTVFAFSPNHFYVHVFLIVMLAIAIDILVPVRYTFWWLDYNNRKQDMVQSARRAYVFIWPSTITWSISQ